MKPRETTKGKNAKPKSKRQRQGFKMGGDADAPHTGGCTHNFHHVSEYYQAERGAPGTAANLVRNLRPWAQASLLGARVIPGSSYSHA